MFNRFNQTHTEVSVTNSITTTEEILFGSYSMGMVIIPTVDGASVTSLTWWVAEKKGGTYVPAYDYDGNAVVQTVEKTRAYPIPLALSGAVAMKAVSNAAGTIAIPMKS